MRGPLNSLMSMTSCSPQQRHLAANGSQLRHCEEGNSSCRNVNNNFYSFKVVYEEFLRFNRVLQPVSLSKDEVNGIFIAQS